MTLVQPSVSWRAYGPVLVVRFNEPPTAAVARELIQVTAQLTTAGEKLSFVGVVPDRLQSPSPEFRELLAQQRETITKNALSIHFAIEGSGLLANLQRAMLGALSAVVSVGVPFSIHRSGVEAMLAVGKLRNRLMTEEINDARRRGLVQHVADGGRQASVL